MPPSVLVLTERLPESGMALLASRPDVETRILPEPSQSALAAAIAEADGVVMAMEQPALTADIVARAPRLRIACRFGAGYDNFDVAALTARGIPIATTGGTNAPTVAEQALYLMLALAKRGPALDRAVKSGGWPRGFGGVELMGKTCVVVGYGFIGRQIARRVAAFDMRVIVVDPHVAPEPATGFIVETDLRRALPQADFVILACALNEATRGLIGRQTLAAMKPTAFVINIARGPVVDEAALAEALAAGRLAGAGLDVLREEPPARESPLLGRDDVVFTPHTAAYIRETFERVA
ncbi:MAG: 3-phosphoglycerate dehydrogenase, partial [Alphaproteobacteria bacterium]|nr:3-phosphoglycerate dehydrogenase [Alphaproteobacteria bacterium]